MLNSKQSYYVNYLYVYIYYIYFYLIIYFCTITIDYTPKMNYCTWHVIFKTCTYT